MKKHWSTIILISIFFIGLSVLLYPTISNYINELSATKAIINYEAIVKNMDEDDYERILESARQYNHLIAQTGGRIYGNGAPIDPDYLAELNVSGDGMMGYVEIKKLGVSLPIYHGTSDEVLLHHTGHLEGSSLPIGGESTHAIITGHRGLPSAKLFTDLDRLEIGDTFEIVIMKETLTYEVEDISVVLPENVAGLGVVAGEDYVTLVTCTPYAVNTHRLLVRGTRIETRESRSVTADAIQIDPLLVAPVVAAPLLLGLLVLLLVSTGKKRGKMKEKDNTAKEGG
ncbi:MAG: class C sortase [Oscillospiraceae bacterium]|jgi:sortase A|nr:class C sortase [Oscillospiraceae bacterium]